MSKKYNRSFQLMSLAKGRLRLKYYGKNITSVGLELLKFLQENYGLQDVQVKIKRESASIKVYFSEKIEAEMIFLLLSPFLCHNQPESIQIPRTLKLLAKKLKSNQVAYRALVLDEFLQEIIKESRCHEVKFLYSGIKNGPQGLFLEGIRQTTGNHPATDIFIKSLLAGPSGAITATLQTLSSAIGLPIPAFLF